MEQYNEKVLEMFRNPKNMGEMKDADGVGKVGNPRCLLPTEKIHTNPELIQISKLDKTKKVLNHKGGYSQVEETSRRKYNGNITILKNQLGNVSLTPEHLVYAIKLPDKKQKYFRTKNKKKLIPAWYHAENLEKRDIILYPIPKKTEDVKFISFDIPKLKYDFKSKDLPNKIPINSEFLRLSGYFLAERHISERKCNNHISICFNINEKEYVKDTFQLVKKLFGIDAKIEEDVKKNTTKILIYSARLSRFFKRLFNKGAQNKELPDFMMFLPVEKQKDLIKGMWRGDGYVNLNRDGARVGYSTISPKLAYQLKLLLLRQKIVPSIYFEKEKIVRGIKHKESYIIHVGQRDSLKNLCDILGIKYTPKSYTSVTSWFDNNYLYTPITKTEQKKYSGLVYNLEIPGSHSFVSEAFTLHNCGDVMYVYIKVKDNKISDIKFQTLGCPAAIATSSMVTQLAMGKTLDEALKITNKDVADALGKLPPIKMHCSNLAADALKAAIADYRGKDE